MATIPRTFLTTSKADLANQPLVNGQFWIIWDADEAWYDAPDDGTPTGIPVRRRITSIKVISELPETGVEDLLYIYIPADQSLWDLRVWSNNAWCVVGNVTPDTKVQTDTYSGKFYITGTTSIDDEVVGTLVKNENAYVQNGVIYADLNGNATTATTATTATRATTADTAGQAIKDNAPVPNNITSYLHSVSSDATTNLGSTLTFTDGLGTETTVRVSDTTYSTFTDAIAGLVPPASGGTASDLVLTGAGWVDKDILPVGSAETAESATKDSANQTITTTYYANANLVDGDLILTKGDGITYTTINLPSAPEVFDQDTDGLVPAPSQPGETNMFLKGDGTWASVPVSNYQGATGISGGTAGLVPPASAGQMNRFLRGDGTWGTTFSIGNDGLVPAPAGLSDEDKFLQVVSDGQGGLVGHWTSSGLDTKNTAGASPYTPGTTDTSDLFTGDGTTTTFDLTLPVIEFNEVTINDVETFAYTYNSETNKIVFDTAPANDAIINVDYQTYDTTEIMYLVGATEQTANPQTYTNASVYVQDNYIHSNGYQVVDVNSVQDINNKTFGGNALNTAAFRRADDSVTITNVTLTQTFIADGVEVDFTVNNPITSVSSVVVSELTNDSETFTGDGTTTEFELTDVPLSITYVDIDGSQVSSYNFNQELNTIIFDEAPIDQAVITVTYTIYAPITTPSYTVNTSTNTITFDTAPLDTNKIDITYITPDPDYDASDVPTNQAVITYTNGRVSRVQQDLIRRVSIDVVADSYDNTSTYDIGDYCMYYDGDTTQLYRCVSTISTAETWDDTHWDSLTITELTDELSSRINIYSSTETLVGKWIDGSDLYEQTLTLSSLTASTATTVAHSITADKIFIKEGFTEYTVTNVDYTGLISAYKATADTEELCVKIDTTNITYLAGTDLSGATAYITVRYTKSAL